MAGQLVRSATSAAADYEEARAAESCADFLHKMQTVLKELKESRYWLRLIVSAELLPPAVVDGPLGQSEKLCRIVAKSVVTAKSTA